MLVREGDLQRAQAAGELVHGARADDRRGDRRLVEQPGQSHVGGRLADVLAEALVLLQFGAVRLDPFLDLLRGAAALLNFLQRAAEHAARQRAPGDQAQADRVQSIVDALNRHAYGYPLKPIVLSHWEVVAPVVERLRELRQERWACIMCKRAMLARAAAIAQEIGASALVTGDSLGQVASQTLSNLEVVSHGISKPILRPLIGMDKTEIMDLARRIGTYEPSTARPHEPDGQDYACPFLPSRPVTQATLEKLLALVAEMEEPRGEHVAVEEADV